MKAPVFIGVGKPLAIETVPDPVPGPGKLVLRIARCGICGSDLHATAEGDDAIRAGTVLGHEFAGEVVAVGAGVEQFRLGDHVTSLGVGTCGRCGYCISGDPLWCSQRSMDCLGGAAQYAAVDAHSSIRLPGALSLVDGALIEPLACALHSVHLARIQGGARILILGAGPIGLATAFWARHLGATRVVVSARSRRNEHLALRLGATDFLLSTELVDSLQPALGGRPDTVFECVGAPHVIAHAIDLVRPRGAVVVAGVCMRADEFHPLPILLKEVRIQGSFGFNLREFQTVADVLEGGATSPRELVTHTVTLAELPEAFEALRQPTNQCKVMIDPWG